MEVDWVGIAIGAVLFLAGLVVSFRVGQHVRKHPEFRTAQSFTTLHAPRQWGRGKLSFTYAGNELPMVAQTRIAFWSHSGDAIRSSHLVDSDPLRIEVSDGDEILDLRLVTKSRNEIGLELTPDGRIDFEVLENGDGGVIEILHRGHQPAVLRGIIAGARRPSVRHASLGAGARRAVRTGRFKRLKLMRRRSRNLVLFSAAVAVVFGFIGLYASLLIARSFVIDPALVDLSEFDLSTTEGQFEFASAVNSDGAISQVDSVTLAILLVTSILMVALAARRSWRATTPVVPASIVRLDQGITGAEAEVEAD